MLIVRVDDDGISRLTAQLTERLMALGDAEADDLGRSLRDFLEPNELAKMFEVRPGNQPGNRTGAAVAGDVPAARGPRMSGVTLSLTEDQAFTLQFCYMGARSHVTDPYSPVSRR